MSKVDDGSSLILFFTYKGLVSLIGSNFKITKDMTTDKQMDAALSWAKKVGIIKDLAVYPKEGVDYEIIV